MLQQRWEAKTRRKESLPQQGIKLTTTRSWVWHAHRWANRIGCQWHRRLCHSFQCISKTEWYWSWKAIDCFRSRYQLFAVDTSMWYKALNWFWESKKSSFLPYLYWLWHCFRFPRKAQESYVRITLTKSRFITKVVLTEVHGILGILILEL